MNVEEAIDWIHNRLRLGIKPGLSRMEWMIEKMDHPEKKIKIVHIGGTNGKGSTVTFIRQVLQAAGYSVGTFTSPYIETFNERISVNGHPIPDDDLAFITEKIIPLANELEANELGGPTEFEVITAMCFYYFAYVKPVDLVLLEVGLGGRFDSTNVVTPLLSVITNIGKDHTHILGDRLSEIAYEKAGIIKEKTPVIFGVGKEEAMDVLREKASEMNAPVYEMNRDFYKRDHHPVSDGERFHFSSAFGEEPNVLTGLKGSHQADNASVAIMVVHLLKRFGYLIHSDDIIVGIKETFWPGRFETVSKGPLVIVDGAHNEEGIVALTNTLSKRYTNNRVHILFAALKDKPILPMINQLKTVASVLSVTTFDFPRAASVEDLLSLDLEGNIIGVSDWKSWLIQHFSNVSEENVLVVTGSLYFISDVKKWFKEKNR